jgi:hypothetical protein
MRDKLTQCEREKFSLIFGSKPFRMAKRSVGRGSATALGANAGNGGGHGGTTLAGQRHFRVIPQHPKSAPVRLQIRRQKASPRPHTWGQSAAKAADQFVQKARLTELGPRQDSRHARKPVGSGPVSAVGAGSDGAADRDPPAPLGINRTSGAILAGECATPGRFLWRASGVRVPVGAHLVTWAFSPELREPRSFFLSPFRPLRGRRHPH